MAKAECHLVSCLREFDIERFAAPEPGTIAKRRCRKSFQFVLRVVIFQNVDEDAIGQFRIAVAARA